MDKISIKYRWLSVGVDVERIVSEEELNKIKQYEKELRLKIQSITYLEVDNNV